MGVRGPAPRSAVTWLVGSAVLLGGCGAAATVSTGGRGSTPTAAPGAPAAPSSTGLGPLPGSTGGARVTTTVPSPSVASTTSSSALRPGTTEGTTTVAAGGSSTTATARSGGLSITLTATPATSPSGQTVTFTLKADEQHATGALTYQVSFGDGATDQNAGPMFCQAGPGSPDTQTWQLTHAYGRAGTYTVSATVRANCTSDQATATVTERVG